jgi:glutamate N-acetyltransferase/amino-acid N-acetyltransferase
MLYELTTGGVLAAEGFIAAALSAGIKKDGVLDMVMIHSLYPAAAAATLTQNVFRAAPTYVTREAVADGTARTIIVNSGNANCATGTQGMADARRMGELAAELTGVAITDTIVCSTGRIGVPLPMDKVEAGIEQLAQSLSREDPVKIARGILTTDTVEKISTTRFTVNGQTVHLGGICKGAGMICPNMATMLCFITTDLAIAPDLLNRTLQAAVKHSFNCISVDGDMSTNDTVAILANGAAGNLALQAESDEGFAAFQAALNHVCRDLAQQIVRDGEEVTKFLEIQVTGAPDYDTAHELARKLATYTLFKCAVFGADFNWGRIAAALGSSLLPFDPAQTTITWQGIVAWREGEPQAYDEAAAQAAAAADDHLIVIDLGAGEASCTYWTSDLTPGYVEYNTH